MGFVGQHGSGPCLLAIDFLIERSIVDRPEYGTGLDIGEPRPKRWFRALWVLL